MEKANITSFSEKNRFCYTVINTIKDNIIKSKNPIYNPLLLTGLDKGLRYRIFWTIFNKEFNRLYKEIYSYRPIDNIELNDIKTKKLVIFENLDLLNDNKELQAKITQIIDYCLENELQIILCSNEDVNKLKINDLLRTKITSGLSIKLKK